MAGVKTERIERRFVPIANLELRVEGEGEEKRFRGYAAVFGSRSVDLGGFVEEIEPGFFDPVMGDDVVGVFNHDSSLLLGRTTSGTLRIAQDGRGLSFEIDHPGTSFANDLERLIDRRDVAGASFAFQVRRGGDKITELDDGTILRTLTRGGAKRLWDLGPVTNPAYIETDATVAQRSIEAWREERVAEAEREVADLDLRRKRLALMG